MSLPASGSLRLFFPSRNQVIDQGDQREDEEDVYKGPRNVKRKKPAQPKNEQDDEEHEKHRPPPVELLHLAYVPCPSFELVFAQALPAAAAVTHAGLCPWDTPLGGKRTPHSPGFALRRRVGATSPSLGRGDAPRASAVASQDRPCSWWRR